MDSGRCRRCGRPITAGEITGLGILRTRPEHRGGPLVDFACPGCQTVMQFVPFGNGRFALPGQPPPPPPTDVERVVPWQRPQATPAETAGPKNGATPPPAPPTVPPKPPSPPRRSAPRPPPAASTPAGDVASAAPPLTALRAYDALGLAPTASAADVEKAFRERALLCHPDKVAHLDPDFVALAEQKFRLLQAAKDLLLGVVARPDDVRRK